MLGWNDFIDGFREMYPGAMRLQIIQEVCSYGHTLDLVIDPSDVTLLYREQDGQWRLRIELYPQWVKHDIYHRELTEGRESSRNRWKFVQAVVDELVSPTEVMSKQDTINRRQDAICLQFKPRGFLQGCCL